MDIFRKKDVAKVLRDAEEGLGDAEKRGLTKVLGVGDLTALGIAAIVAARALSFFLFLWLLPAGSPPFVTLSLPA